MLKKLLSTILLSFSFVGLSQESIYVTKSDRDRVKALQNQTNIWNDAVIVSQTATSRLVVIEGRTSIWNQAVSDVGALQGNTSLWNTASENAISATSRLVVIEGRTSLWNQAITDISVLQGGTSLWNTASETAINATGRISVIEGNTSLWNTASENAIGATGRITVIEGNTSKWDKASEVSIDATNRVFVIEGRTSVWETAFLLGVESTNRLQKVESRTSDWNTAFSLGINSTDRLEKVESKTSFWDTVSEKVNILSGSSSNQFLTSPTLTNSAFLGNVGIGTNVPVSKLHINGNTRVESNLTVMGGYFLNNTNLDTRYLRADIANSNYFFSLNGTEPSQMIPGQMSWESAWQTPAVKLNSHVTGQLFLEDFIMVTNILNVTIPDGGAIFTKGSSNGFQIAYALTSTNDEARFASKGLATEPIPPYGFGHMTVRGDVNDLNTSAYEQNDTIYASKTPFEWTKIEPQYPENVFVLGKTTIISPTIGRIAVQTMYLERQPQSLVGNLYGYASITSFVPSYVILSNSFASSTNYYTTNIVGATNNQTLLKFLVPTRVNAVSGGDVILKFYGDISKNGQTLGGVIAKLIIYDNNMVELASALSYTVMDQTPYVERSITIPVQSNLTFSTTIRVALILLASFPEGTAARDYRIYTEDGRPLSLAIPLPSSQFAFRSDLANYVPLATYNAEMPRKLNVSGDTATNLNVVGPLIVRGLDFTDDISRFYPQSNGVHVVGATNQDLYFGLGGIPGTPAWWIQTYRDENPSAPNSPEFLYLSNGQSQKDIMMLSEGGRMAVNKASNIFDYHSDYLGYLMGGLNDADFGGTYTYSKQRKYWISIVSTGAIDRWTWKKSLDNGATYIESGITNNCTTNFVTVENGMTCKFGNITGHNTNDAWVRVGFSQLPSASVHLSPAAYDEVLFTTNYNNMAGTEDITYTMASTIHSADRYALTNTTSAIYLGRHIKMNSTFFNIAEFATGLSLVFEYWNGSTWVALTANSHFLSDGTANFTQSGQVSWDKTLLTNWTTNGIQNEGSSYEMYWIRVRTSTTPTIPPRIRNITPQGKVRLGVMGRQYDEDYSFYVDGFGSSYQVKGYQTDTGSAFEVNQLITAGAVNKLLDAFRNFTLYFATNNHPVSSAWRILTTEQQPSFSSSTALVSGTNLIYTFVNTNTIGSTTIPANTKYSTIYYAAKSTTAAADTFWDLVEIGLGYTNIIARSQSIALVQTTPTIINITVSPTTNVTVSASSYLGVRIYGIRKAGNVNMLFYLGGGYGSALISPSLGGGAATAGIPDAPSDNIAYGRKNSAWTQVLEPNGSGANLSGIVKKIDVAGTTNSPDVSGVVNLNMTKKDVRPISINKIPLVQTPLVKTPIVKVKVGGMAFQNTDNTQHSNSTVTNTIYLGPSIDGHFSQLFSDGTNLFYVNTISQTNKITNN